MTASTSFRVLAATLLTLLSALAVGCAAQEDLGGAPLKNGDASKTYEGTRLTPSQVASELRAAGFPEDTVGKMLCTAKYESTYYERASGRDGRLVTRGLLMISSKYVGERGLSGCPSDAEDLYDASKNAKCAHAVFKAEGMDAWGSSYGRHKSECDKMKAPPAPGSTTSTSVPTSTPDPADVSEAEGGPTPAPATTPTTPDPATPAPTTPAPTPTTPAPTPTTPAPTPAPAPAPAIVGGCFSNTLQDTMEPMACVESKFDLVWQQCKDGKWYRGGDDTNGKFGPCNGSFPLPE